MKHIYHGMEPSQTRSAYFPMTTSWEAAETIAKVAAGKASARARYVLPRLVAALKRAPTEDERVLLLMSLWIVGPESALVRSDIEPYLAADAEWVRVWAARALFEATWDAKRLVPVNLPLLRSQEAKVRLEAIWNLHRIGAAAHVALDELERLKDDPDERVAERASGAVPAIKRQHKEEAERRRRS